MRSFVDHTLQWEKTDYCVHPGRNTGRSGAILGDVDSISLNGEGLDDNLRMMTLIVVSAMRVMFGRISIPICNQNCLGASECASTLFRRFLYQKILFAAS